MPFHQNKNNGKCSYNERLIIKTVRPKRPNLQQSVLQSYFVFNFFALFFYSRTITYKIKLLIR